MLTECDIRCGEACGAADSSSGCTDASWDDVKAGLEPPGVSAGTAGSCEAVDKFLGSLASEDDSVGVLTDAAAEADEPVAADAV